MYCTGFGGFQAAYRASRLLKHYRLVVSGVQNVFKFWSYLSLCVALSRGVCVLSWIGGFQAAYRASRLMKHYRLVVSGVHNVFKYRAIFSYV